MEQMFNVPPTFKSFNPNSFSGLNPSLLCKFMAVIFDIVTRLGTVQTIHSDPSISFVNAFSVFQLYKEAIDHRSLSTISVIQEKIQQKNDL